MRVCEQLKNLRCSLNLSQERFGRRLGVSGKSISAYETGRCVPNVRVLRQIANEFNVGFIEIPSDNRKYLQDRLNELENCFDELKNVLDQILSSENNY